MQVSCDCRDFDLWVRLLDVYPDGRAINLMSPGNDVLRASYRLGDRTREPLQPGKQSRAAAADAADSRNLFGEGHSIRAQVSVIVRAAPVAQPADRTTPRTTIREVTACRISITASMRPRCYQLRCATGVLIWQGTAPIIRIGRGTTRSQKPSSAQRRCLPQAPRAHRRDRDRQLSASRATTAQRIRF